MAWESVDEFIAAAQSELAGVPIKDRDAAVKNYKDRWNGRPLPLEGSLEDVLKELRRWAAAESMRPGFSHFQSTSWMVGGHFQADAYDGRLFYGFCAVPTLGGWLFWHSRW